MLMKNSKKLLVIFATVILLVLAVTATIAAVAYDPDNNISSDNPKTVLAFDNSAPSHAPSAQITGVYGIRMGYGAPFNKVGICMPTWNTTDSECTISLYKWDENYVKTIESTPIYSEKFSPLRDNAINWLEFDEQPAGEYFVCISDTKGQVGVWQRDKAVCKGYAYMDGIESEIDWEMQVGFTKTPVEPFYQISKASDAIDGNHKAPEEYVIPEDSLLYTHKVMPDTWVFTDALGRESVTFDDVGGLKEDKTIALFYWTWHADLGTANPVNLTEFMEKYPEAKNNYYHSAWPGSACYFWNEPIYGYYKTDDPWVLRKQGEMLANAGVDTVFTDNTNGNFTWRKSYIPLYETWDDAQKNGAVNVPKISYLLPFGPTGGSKEQIISIYLDIYRNDKYQNLWFYWKGKPMLMAYKTNFTANVNVEKEILSFFNWRPGQPGYLVDNTAPNTWGWLSTYPQALYATSRSNLKNGIVEQMTVGCAVNHNYVTHQITAMNGNNVIGRSYSSTYEDRYDKEGKSATLWGYNFSEQFDYALEVNPSVIFVTGWNEWTAGRHQEWSAIQNAFPDQYIDEFSRDIEPTKGALKDNYYYLFVNYIRKFKGCNPIPTPSIKTTITLDGGEEQWKNVEPYFASYIGNTGDRDASGYGSLKYTETSGRNDIIGAQIARDDEFIYFHVECNENITPYTDDLWMTLYIDCNSENKGWETFDFVVNRDGATADKLLLEKFVGDNEYKTEKVAEVEYKLDGKHLTVKVAKSDIGLNGDDFTINFTWTDNVHDEGDYTKFSGDIMDFYISGDVAPGGRFKFSYRSTGENSVETTTTTEEVTSENEETTVSETESTEETSKEEATTTISESESETEAETQATTTAGCKSTAGIAAMTITLVGIGTALVIKKKENI